jgi:tetratricopeptide (TPR) repeat protein
LYLTIPIQFRLSLFRYARWLLAISSLPIIVSAQPSERDCVERGSRRYEQGDIDGAITEFNRAITINEDFAEAYNHRGLAKAYKLDFLGAIADYSEAVEIRPELADAYKNRAVANAGMGDFADAISDSDRAIELCPRFAKAYHIRGVAKAGQRAFEGAIADYNRAIQLDPKLVQVYYNRALAKADNGAFGDAISDYDLAIKSNSLEPDAHFGRGVAKQIRGSFDEALADFVRSGQLAPPGGIRDYAQLYIWLIRLRSGQTVSANRELAAYLAERSPSKDWVSTIGRFLLNGITETELFERARSSDPKKSRGLGCEAWYYAGMKRLIAGDRTTATDYFRKCLATGETLFNEYRFAQAEIDAMKCPCEG